ncbi:hypothetical protein DID88_008246 [Monilinia fructigena]|uniref:Ras-associating domain-containing protein n=1 Tax=Monilinia fructigena TaxID=38457 RepID=A0A395J569_9HELO|nr:hypothetical protein DID88_008246 [Monilinia fructigena]
MGIEKIGDRVRLFLGIKKLRRRRMPTRRRGTGILLQPWILLHTLHLLLARNVLQILEVVNMSTSTNKRFSRHAATISGRRPTTPSDPTQPQIARLTSGHTRLRIVVLVMSLMRLTLKKFGYREDHDRNYCFWVLAGVDADPSQCRRLPEAELWRIIKDQRRSERNRLILRKIHAGEPGDDELQRAASIALEEATTTHNRAIETSDNKRSQLKVQKMLGETWNDNLQHPLSPASFQSTGSNLSITERERNVYNTAKDLERPLPADSREGSRLKMSKKGGLRHFFGQRPPSELITSDLTTYFPDHPREEIDRTARLHCGDLLV